MPFSKSMRNAVLQAVFLHIVKLIVSHHLWSSTEADFTNQLFHLFPNTTELSNNATSPVANLNGPSTASQDISHVVNGTSAFPNSNDKSFYWNKLPRDIAIAIVIAVLEYYWQIWLERILPARPRIFKMVGEKDLLDEDDAREDLLVKKWIAKGKIRRASLSLWNTACKWILDMSVGQLWIVCVSYVLEELLRSESGRLLETSNVKGSWDSAILSRFWTFSPWHRWVRS